MAQTDFGLERHHLRMSRQTQLINAKVADKLSVLILGAGSIGSNAAHLCASTGIHDITIVDHDVVKEENIFPSWLYPTHIGRPKVEAVRLQLLEYGIISKSHHTTIEDIELNPSDMYDIIIVATDTIESRQLAFNKFSDRAAWWLDGRMGGPSCELFTIDYRDGHEKLVYEKLELRPVNSDLLCGEKSTAYNTKGSLMQFMGWSIRDIMAGVKPPYQLVSFGVLEEVIRANELPSLTEDE